MILSSCIARGRLRLAAVGLCSMNRVAVFMVLLISTAGILSAQAEQSEADTRMAIHRLLRESGKTWSEVPQLQDALVAQGVSAVSELFSILVEEAFEGPEESQGFLLPLNPQRALALRGAIEGLPRRATLSFLNDVSRRAGSVDQRVEALRLLGRFGSGDTLDLILRLAPRSPKEQRIETEAREMLRETLLRILKREPEALSKLDALLAQSQPAIRVICVGAIGALETRQAFEVLANAVGRWPGLDAPVLAELRHSATEHNWPFDPNVSASLNRAFQSPDAAAVVLGILTLGQLRDHSAVPAIIEALERDDASVRSAARDVLHSLTGLHLGSQAEPWRAWHAAEWEWFEVLSESTLDSVRTGDGATAADAIRSLAKHRVFGEQLTRDLLPALDRDEAYVVELACAALGQLRSWDAVPGLISSLEHDAPVVRTAARTALVQITGLDLPADPAYWRQRLPETEAR